MTVTIVDAVRPVTGSGEMHPDLKVAPRLVTGGVDTHLDLNVAAALDGIGGLLRVAEFSATLARHRDLLGWLAGFGPVARVGVEGTGSYGAGLARFLRGAGVEIVEVDRPNRQARRRSGKSDPLDAIEAARAALSGGCAGRPINSYLDRACDPGVLPHLLVAAVLSRQQPTDGGGSIARNLITAPSLSVT